MGVLELSTSCGSRSHDAGMGLVVESKRTKHTVTQVTVDGAAERGGLQEGDRLTHYEWVDPANPLLGWQKYVWASWSTQVLNRVPVSRLVRLPGHTTTRTQQELAGLKDRRQLVSLCLSEYPKHRRDSTECPYTTKWLQELERHVYFHDREKWLARHPEDQWQHGPMPREDFLRSVTPPRDSDDKAESTNSHKEIALSSSTPYGRGQTEMYCRATVPRGRGEAGSRLKAKPRMIDRGADYLSMASLRI